MYQMTLVKKKEEQFELKQKNNHDKHRGVRELSSFNQGDTVWIPNQDNKAVVEEELAPRS